MYTGPRLHLLSLPSHEFVLTTKYSQFKVVAATSVERVIVKPDTCTSTALLAILVESGHDLNGNWCRKEQALPSHSNPVLELEAGMM